MLALAGMQQGAADALYHCVVITEGRVCDPTVDDPRRIPAQPAITPFSLRQHRPSLGGAPHIFSAEANLVS